MDYGALNAMIGRPVDQNWWGTRTQHIVGVAAALAVTDHSSQALMARYLGRPLCFASAPATFVVHTFAFIFAGVTLYVAHDAAYNPQHEGSRVKAFTEGTYSSAVGSCTAWFEPYVAPTLAKVAGPALAGTWFGSALLPATLAYATVRVSSHPLLERLVGLSHTSCTFFSCTQVKGCGWNDWGNSGLNDHEMRLNGLAK